MKASFLALATAIILCSNSFAQENKYQCIADKLQAYNSDIYYNLSDSDIYSMLTIPEMFGHLDATKAQIQCELEAKTKSEYQCVADRLEATNSDIYYGLSESDVYSMLTIPEMFGHYDAVNALKLCTKIK
jgi:hypothetical protein